MRIAGSLVISKKNLGNDCWNRWNHSKQGNCNSEGKRPNKTFVWQTCGLIGYRWISGNLDENGPCCISANLGYILVTLVDFEFRFWLQFRLNAWYKRKLGKMLAPRCCVQYTFGPTISHFLGGKRIRVHHDISNSPIEAYFSLLDCFVKLPLQATSTYRQVTPVPNMTVIDWPVFLLHLVCDCPLPWVYPCRMYGHRGFHLVPRCN